MELHLKQNEFNAKVVHADFAQTTLGVLSGVWEGIQYH